MRFYTNTYTRGNLVYIRGYDNGRRFVDKIPYSPTFYLASKRDSKFKTTNGVPVEPVEQGSIREARDFVKRYEDVSGFTVYGSTMYEYTCLNEKYGNDYDIDHIRIANIDIEVGSEEGFPEPAWLISRSLLSLSNRKVECLCLALANLRMNDLTLCI